MATTAEQRQKAITKALTFAADGMTANAAATKAGKTCKVTGRTVQRWAIAAGTPISTASHDKTKRAREEHRLQYQEQRELLKIRMAQLAHDVIDRCYTKHYDYVSSKGGPVRVDYELPKSGDVKNYTTAAAILLDKCRLEEGKATERTESLSVGAVEAWLSEQERELAINDG